VLDEALVDDKPLLHALEGIVVPPVLDQQHLAKASGTQHGEAVKLVEVNILRMNHI
jgi:hypothetical protein